MEPPACQRTLRLGQCLHARHHDGLALNARKRTQQAGRSAFDRLILLCSLLQRQGGFDTLHLGGK